MSTTVSAARESGLRDLILVLADSKRLLGTRYAEWILGAPELETGIACASMAQDEWGHARLLYALLKEFGDDVDQLEHGRDSAAYRNLEVLDHAPGSWPDVVVLNALVDSALTVQLEALAESEYAPLRQRVGKLVEEEVFHSAHGLAWARRLSGTAAGSAALAASVEKTLIPVARWFGNAEFAGLRTVWLERVAPVLNGAGAALNFDFDGFDPATRRSSQYGPDPQTIARVRGDKNRAFLMD